METLEREKTSPAMATASVAPHVDHRGGFAVAVMLGYAALALFAALHHEPWRDEMQAWLLARDSRSLLELFQHLRYEGTPGLWHLMLMGLSRLVPNPAVMQAVHLVIATATVFVVSRWSPFSRLQCVLFAAGYYSLFEYGAICRNYAIAVLLSVTACALIPRRRQFPLLMAGVLFLLCQTCLHGVLIAFAMTAWLILDLWRDTGVPRRRLLTGLGIIAAGACLAVLQMRQPPDAGFMAGWNLSLDQERVTRVIGALLRSYLPVPALQRQFWNTHVTDMLSGSLLIQGLCGLWIAVGAVALFWSTPRVFAFYAVGTLSLLVFSYVKHSGGYRHDGFLFITLLMSFWILQRTSPDTARGDQTRKNRILTGLLAVQVVGAGIALRYDAIAPFSCGGLVALTLERDDAGQSTIVFEPDYCASSVLASMPAARGYFPRGDRFGTFVVWDTRRLNEVDFVTPLPDALLVNRARAQQANLVVINRPMNSRDVTLLSRFTGSIVADEQFHIYQIHAPNQAPAAR